MLDDCQFVTRDVDDTDNDLPDRNQRSTATRGFRDQNAGLDPGWLVAAGGSKKKMDVTNFLPSRAHLSTNDHKFSVTHYVRFDWISSETMYNRDSQINTRRSMLELPRSRICTKRTVAPRTAEI